MKQLLTIGDSFTFGDELSDRFQAWPYKVASDNGFEVHNMGQSGCSNSSILRRCIEELAVNNYDLVIVGWTSPGRVEWKDAVGVAYDVWPGYQVSTSSNTECPWRTKLVDYISIHHSPEYFYEQYLIHVISLQSYFRANRIKYCMIDVRQSDYYRSVGQELHGQLDKLIDYDTFIQKNTVGMTEIAGNLKAPGGHPNANGHKRIANEITKHIRN